MLITLAKDDPQRLIELEKYNKKVDGFEQMANENNPAKKVKGMKLSFEPPSKAIKNKKRQVIVSKWGDIAWFGVFIHRFF